MDAHTDAVPTDAVPAEKLERFKKLCKDADELRPPIQAFMDLVVASAKAAARVGGDPDEIWAAMVVQVADGLGLDVEHPRQVGAALFVAEMVMQGAA